MKKLLWAAALTGCMICFAACGRGSKAFYTVTFVQAGQPDIVKTVEAGETLTDIPSVREVTGYTVSWENTDLSRISADMTVHAVRIPNEYTVIYDGNGGTVSASSESFTYDARYTLPTPVRGNYSFVCWKNGEEAVSLEGVWTTAENVTLTAFWREILPETYTVTFIQEGQPNIEKTVKREEALSDIPSPVAVPGYEIAWNRTDFSSIRENVTVTAVATAKIYLIAYDLGELKNHEGVGISALTQTVTYGKEYNLLKPYCEGYNFLGWVISGTDQKVGNDIYRYTENLSLTALWRPIETESDEEIWTSFY